MINRLKNLAVYLSGPIDYAQNMGKQWRNEITDFLVPRNVQVFNPLNHIFYGTHDVDTTKRPRMEKMRQDGDFSSLRCEMKDLNHWDLRAVDLSSFLIVNYDVPTFMCGTHEEIFTANRQSKPVLLVIPCDKRKMPSWMFGRFPAEHMFEGWDALKDYLKEIDEDPYYEFTDADRKRWLFFDGPWMKNGNPDAADNFFRKTK